MDGAPLPGVTITISSPALQGTRTTVSDNNGNYNFGALPPGMYTAKFEMESMQTVTKQVNVGLSSTARSNADMKLSAVAEAITVTASAPAVLETTEVQSNISAKLIEDLPIGRTLLATVNLAPGVSNNGVGGNTAISGAPAYDSQYIVDGAVVNELLRGQPQNLFIEDALQETTVQTGAVSAEYGRFTGGVVTAISKSGGNEFSGSLRDSMTNPSWTSKGEKQTAEPTDSTFNQYEATLGGPIMKDRLWFFAAGRKFDQSYQRRFGRTPTDTQDYTFPFADNEQRLEGKLTGQITPKHSLSLSYFDISRDQKNNPFGSPLEATALDASRSLPNSFATINYNGIFTSNFLVEGLYAYQKFEFIKSGGDQPEPLSRGTNVRYPTIGAWAGYPTFCSGCAPFPESRNNYNAKVKGSYFLSTKATGSHTLAGGLETYQDMLKSDNHQSASDYTLYNWDSARRAADGTLLNTMLSGNGSYLIWWPILESSKGNAFKTNSAFVNDKWDFNPHLNFNVGVRYDKNHAKNQSGDVVADDSKFSPRLGVTYDVWGNGRLRMNATYSQYASKIANGNAGDSTSGAGSPSYLYWGYYGPDLVDLPTNQFLDAVSAWFFSPEVGGTKNTEFLWGGGTAGLQTQMMSGGLKSPGMDEYTIGIGSQIGANGFIRGDYQKREWNNFYTNFLNQQTGKVFDPLVGAEGADVDLTLVGTSNDFQRKYDAFLVQASYRAFTHLNLGANYTYSTLKGNIVGETSGGGPGTSGSPQSYLPEFQGYAQSNPVGYLTGDMRHKGRGWIGYDLSTPIGSFNFSLLERYDSGLPYSAAGNVYVAKNSRCPQCRSNASQGTSYTSIYSTRTNTYYFSKRGEFRTDNITATDLSVNYTLPIKRMQLFVQGELINAFNEQGVVNVDSTVRTASSSLCIQNVAVGDGSNVGKRCAAFDPFTQTPVEGVNWRKGPNFGKPINPTSGEPAGGAGDYQLPMTYRFSLGIRF